MGSMICPKMHARQAVHGDFEKDSSQTTIESSRTKKGTVLMKLGSRDL